MKGGEASPAGELEARGARDVGDHRDDLGVRDRASRGGVRDRLEVRPAAGEQDREAERFMSARPAVGCQLSAARAGSHRLDDDAFAAARFDVPDRVEPLPRVRPRLRRRARKVRRERRRPPSRRPC